MNHIGVVLSRNRYARNGCGGFGFPSGMSGVTMTEATWQPIGDLLDALGVQVELGPNDLVASAVCVLAVLVEGCDAPQLTVCTSDGLDWIHQAGLIRIAERMCSEPPLLDDEDGSDGHT